MKVRVKKLCDAAVIPCKAHRTDAGMDLVATSMSVDKEGNIVYGTGLAFEIPEGHVGLLFPRSSNAKKWDKEYDKYISDKASWCQKYGCE